MDDPSSSVSSTPNGLSLEASCSIVQPTALVRREIGNVFDVTVENMIEKYVRFLFI
ncbi:hypothetical protein OHB54_16930 [Streptomyces sp. NBC_01007]|nr:hypothetical protein OHB54_16930 [Streptomyces sp. NBC_01007]